MHSSCSCSIASDYADCGDDQSDKDKASQHDHHNQEDADPRTCIVDQGERCHRIVSNRRDHGPLASRFQNNSSLIAVELLVDMVVVCSCDFIAECGELGVSLGAGRVSVHNNLERICFRNFEEEITIGDDDGRKVLIDLVDSPRADFPRHPTPAPALTIAVVRAVGAGHAQLPRPIGNRYTVLDVLQATGWVEFEDSHVQVVLT